MQNVYLNTLSKVAPMYECKFILTQCHDVCKFILTHCPNGYKEGYPTLDIDVCMNTEVSGQIMSPRKRNLQQRYHQSAPKIKGTTKIKGVASVDERPDL
jgi:hypothetical protein